MSTHAAELDAFRAAGVRVVVRQVRRLIEGDDGYVVAVELAGGERLDADAVAVTPRLRVRTEPFASLGLTALLGDGATARLLRATGGGEPLNQARLTFDPAGAQPSIANFDEVGRELLWRIQREVLADPGDGELRDLLDDLLAMETVDPGWRSVDLVAPSDPALVLHLRTADLDLRFLTTITAFQAPQNVAVEHVRIETWLPYDDATADACRQMARGEGRTRS